MISCTISSTCWFYRHIMPDLKEIAPHLESTFCRNNYTGCARFLVHAQFGPENVPLGLFPIDTFSVRTLSPSDGCKSYANRCEDPF